MRAVILAGGFGSRLAEETESRPKPMVEIGGRPILWHILKGLSHHGIDDFVIALGYKGELIKQYFAGYHLHMGDVTIDLAANTMQVHRSRAEPWRVTLVDTGEATMTGGRIKRLAPYLEGDDAFLLTYGDGLADVDVGALVDTHRRSGGLATITAVKPPGRFGAMDISDGRVTGFTEKPHGQGGWVNGGFFVLSPQVLDHIEGDGTTWEREPLERLAAEGQLGVHEHAGFFHPMDTVRDRQRLEELWQTDPPWRVWS